MPLSLASCQVPTRKCEVIFQGLGIEYLLGLADNIALGAIVGEYEDNIWELSVRTFVLPVFLIKVVAVVPYTTTKNHSWWHGVKDGKKVPLYFVVRALDCVKRIWPGYRGST